MRVWLVLLILVLEVWAIASVLGSRRRTRIKAAWTFGIILLPVVGVLAWMGRGNREPPRDKRAT